MDESTEKKLLVILRHYLNCVDKSVGEGDLYGFQENSRGVRLTLVKVGKLMYGNAWEPQEPRRKPSDLELIFDTEYLSSDGRESAINRVIHAYSVHGALYQGLRRNVLTNEANQWLKTYEDKMTKVFQEAKGNNH